MPEGAKLEDSEITGPLAKHCGQERAEEIFYRVLAKRFLCEDDETYGIPIPSMWNWLKEDYPPEKVHDNTEEQHRNVADDEGKEASSEGAIKREQDTNSGMDIEQ